MHIRQISTGSGARSSEELRNLAVAEFVASYPISEYAEFYQFHGNADTPRKIGNDFDAGGNRGIDSSYTPKERHPQFGALALKIYGDVVKTDIAYERRGFDIGSQRTLDLTNFGKSLGRYFMDSTVNHDVGANPLHFSGLKVHADELSRKVNFEGVNGGELPRGVTDAEKTQVAKFLEFLDEHIEDIAGGPQFILCNGRFKARLKTIARDFVTTARVQDIFGRDQVLEHYMGIPLVNAGFKANNTGLIITNAETEGTNDDCTSIYLVRFGEKQDVTFGTNVGLDVQDLGLVDQVKWHTLIEFDVDLEVLNKKAMKRLSGIRVVN